jgi:L-ascorbate metabolism protein UlaG (beta-lactamase superfamily)
MELKSIVPVICLLLFGCASSMNYPKSDHYDGDHFLNPTQSEKNGFWRTIKLLASVRFKDWPDWIQNETDSKVHQSLNEDEIAITFINHATVLIQAKGINILTDPVWSERVSPVSWAGPKRSRDPGLTLEELPRIDLVVVSHNHYDHMDLATLKKLNDKFAPVFLVPLGDKKFLQDEGLKQTSELDWWQSFLMKNDVTVTFAPAQHQSGRGLLDWYESLWGSFMIKIGNKRIYFGGDAAYSKHYTSIRERLGRPDISLLPIGAYEPRWFMKHVHMNPDDAVQAHIDLGSKISIPIHFGTFKQVNEAVDDPVHALESAKAKAKIPFDTFPVLKEGVTKIFKIN